MLDPALLDILVCPVDRGPLLHIDDVLYNPRLRRAYRIENDIPVLLVDEAADVDTAPVQPDSDVRVEVDEHLVRGVGEQPAHPLARRRAAQAPRAGLLPAHHVAVGGAPQNFGITSTPPPMKGKPAFAAIKQKSIF